jgi:hypothetical protein
MIYLIISIVLGLTVLMCFQESKKRKIEFISSLVFCVVLTPLIGYFIITSRSLRNPKGCNWCGNEQNEVEYCGICGKNEKGDLKD